MNAKHLKNYILLFQKITIRPAHHGWVLLCYYCYFMCTKLFNLVVITYAKILILKLLSFVSLYQFRVLELSSHSIDTSFNGIDNQAHVSVKLGVSFPCFVGGIFVIIADQRQQFAFYIKCITQNAMGRNLVNCFSHIFD